MFIVGFGASVIAKPEKSCRDIKKQKWPLKVDGRREGRFKKKGGIKLIRGTGGH